MRPEIRSRATTLVGLAFGLAVAACGPAGPPPPPFLAIEAAEATRFVRVEIAETEEQRQRGLMGRTSILEDAGMLFVWAEDTTSGFWMKCVPKR
jgi:hypothetical protein